MYISFIINSLDTVSISIAGNVQCNVDLHESIIENVYILYIFDTYTFDSFYTTRWHQ